MQITKCLFTITGKCNDVALRSYNTHVGSTDVEGLYTEATAGGTNLTVGAMSTVAHAILRPQMETSGNIAIDNGFDTRRMRFILEVDYGDGQRQIVSGYTDHVGLTPSGSVDPNMVLHFNQSFRLTDNRFTTPTRGAQIKTNMIDASHYLKPIPLEGNALLGLNNNTKSTTMRPSDVMEQFDLIHAARDYSLDAGFNAPNPGYGDVDTSNIQIVGTRGDFTEGTRMSKISNGHSANYLAKVINGFKNASANRGDAYDDYLTLGSEAANLTREVTLGQDKFVSELTMSGIDFNQGGKCSWGKLTTVFPNLPFISNFNDLSQRMSAMPVLDSRGHAEHWNGSTYETNIATVLNNSIPAVMIDYMLTCLDVTIQTCTGGVHIDPAVGAMHGTVNNGVHVTVTDAKSIAGLSIDTIRNYVPAIENVIATTVALEISQGGNVPVLANVYIDLLGENKVSVAYNYGPLIRYINPTYCSSLSTPILANNENVAINMANDLSKLCETSVAQSDVLNYTY